jgi:hypothetical protein
MKRLFLLLAATLAFQASAQVATTLEVQRLAPQLVAFAGGDVNFANLVNGLALGAPVTLSTPLTTGGSQTFTFTPTGTMSPLQIAQFLESVRQSLISRGIASPTAQQLGATLAGGALATPTAATQSPAAAIQGANSPAATTSAAAGGTVRNMSDSPLPRGISDTPPLPVPGVTAPVQGATVERPVAPTIATVPASTPTVPAVPAPAVRSTGDR